jgi:hypothetical protein
MSDQETIKNVWPDQWFVSDGLNIEGPLTAKEAFASVEKVSEIFKTIEKPKIGSELLVSRKGFTKWYKYSDLHNLYLHGRADNQTIVANLRSDIIDEIDRMKTLLPNEPTAEAKQTSKAIYNPLNSNQSRVNSSTSVTSSYDFTTLEPQRNLYSEGPQAILQDAISHGVFSHGAVSHETTLKNQEAFPLEPGSINEGFVHRPKEEDLAGKSLDYLHIMYRGRLRLGTLSSPFSTAASTLFLFNIPEWVSKFYQEILWHLDDAHFKKKNVSPWLGIFPIINWFVFYRLALAMLAAEVQNNYRSISVFKVLLFSLFPPAGVFYLERAAQKHWITHLTHIQQTHNLKRSKT